MLLLMIIIKVKKTEFQKLYNISCEPWKKKFNDKFKDFIFSDSIEFDKSFLTEMKDACNEDQMKIFNKVFKGQLKDISIEMLTDYKKVCNKLGHKVLTEEDFDFMPEEHRRKALCSAQIQNLEDYFNGNWKKKFDGVQRNFFPYFQKSPAGWSFDCSCYYQTYSAARVGYFKDEETSNYVGRNFIDIFTGIIE